MLVMIPLRRASTSSRVQEALGILAHLEAEVATPPALAACGANSTRASWKRRMAAALEGMLAPSATSCTPLAISCAASSASSSFWVAQGGRRRSPGARGAAAEELEPELGRNPPPACAARFKRHQTGQLLGGEAVRIMETVPPESGGGDDAGAEGHRLLDGVLGHVARARHRDPQAIEDWPRWASSMASTK